MRGFKKFCQRGSNSDGFGVFFSLGPVVNILAIFSNANILKKNKRIKIYHIKGIGCPLMSSIYIDAWGHRWYFPLIIRSAD